jgi:predicted NACHT family NTPase
MRVNNALERYRELLLETCDIIDLANLPEQDRNLAHRELELRRLYVPLRVWVEAKASAKTRDDTWIALEEHQYRTWRGEPRRVDKEAERAHIGHRLSESRRLVILGDPGSGKTTLTRWIATAYLLRLNSSEEWKDLPDVASLPSEDWLPILIRCRDLDTNCLDGSIEDILKHTLRKAELTPPQSLAAEQALFNEIERGNALLIVDGLDEISDPADRLRFCAQLEQITRAYPALPIIATSRIVGYREMRRKLRAGFEHLTLAELTKEEKDDFAQRWCLLTERPERWKQAAAELVADIHSSEGIERLTGSLCS